MLAAAFGRERVYSRMFVPNYKPWAQLTDDDLRGYRAYTDLFDYCDLPLSRKCLPVALLREPLFRAVSLYHFVRRKQTHQLHALAMKSSLQDFYRIGSNANPRYFRNVQTRRVCGRADARLALEYIVTRYLAVGFTSQIDELATALSGIFNWAEVHVERKVPGRGLYETQITPRFRDLVLGQNEEDVALFEAMSRGPPYRIPRPQIQVAAIRRTKCLRDAALVLARGVERRIRHKTG